MSEQTTKSMDEIVALCRRRGFIFQSSEIYGGINGFWDYGPLGAQLKRNLKDAWYQDIIQTDHTGPDGHGFEIVPVDCTIIMHPKVWEASGHVGGFNDPMVDCKTEGCKGRFRADHIKELQCPLKPSKCPGAHDKCQLTEPRQFNLMFQTHTGAVQNEESLTYLRPETAQGIFTQFWNVVDTSRVKVPFGIGQQGKAFRNEVTPRNFTFRSREFEQMEIEFFIRPETAVEWYQYWRDSRYKWWQSIGLTSDNLQLREHDKDELSHYAKEGAGVCDVEYRFPFTSPGYGELEGVAHRSDFDLRAHANACGKGDKLMYFDQERNERYFPHVIEPSAGADRGTLALICEAFTPTPERSGSKFVMNFHPRMAPIKAAIFPLVNKDGMPEVADKLYQSLKKKYVCQIDAKQSIGKRYARMDEAGTPFCFTIDGDSLTDQTVTVRHRDTAHQERIAIDKVHAFLAEKIGG
ncbi:MAG: glycine--tRNA ligase [Planctomycetes bacterium]|nr:glycine--tRNA ligase [Planctomycetota bacterium]